jgi:DNA-binding NarL/FixJ family response regulator
MSTAPETPIRILIIDDSFIVRNGLRATLREARFDVIGEADTGLEGLERAELLEPDIVLMDIRMPDLDGITATKTLIERDPDARIIVLTWSQNGQNLLSAVKAGAKGYLVHGDFTADDLRNAIQTVFDGGALISPALAPLLLDAFRHTSRSVDSPEMRSVSALTPREQDILALIRENFTNRQISEHLGLAEKTVKNYISNIYSKLMVTDRQGAARFQAQAEIDDQ